MAAPWVCLAKTSTDAASEDTCKEHPLGDVRRDHFAPDYSNSEVREHDRSEVSTVG